MVVDGLPFNNSTCFDRKKSSKGWPRRAASKGDHEEWPRTAAPNGGLTTRGERIKSLTPVDDDDVFFGKFNKTLCRGSCDLYARTTTTSLKFRVPLSRSDRSNYVPKRYVTAKSSVLARKWHQRNIKGESRDVLSSKNRWS